MFLQVLFTSSYTVPSGTLYLQVLRTYMYSVPQCILYLLLHCTFSYFVPQGILHLKFQYTVYFTPQMAFLQFAAGESQGLPTIMSVTVASIL